MSYRKILTVLTGGNGDRAALEAAFRLARPANGHVLALVPNPDPREAVPALGEGVSGALVDQIMTMVEQEAKAHVAKARATFDGAREAAAVTLADAAPGPDAVSCRFAQDVGNQEDVVAAQSRLADLTVIAQSPEVSGGEGLLMLEAALLDSGRGVVVVPPAADLAAGLGRRVAVAWNGSREAAVAVAQALPLLKAAEVVHIIACVTSKTDGAITGQLADYLAWHGVNAEVGQPVAEGQPVGAVLLAAAQAARADMLVLGGYGHSRLREFILGGVTRHVLNNTTIPLLLAH